MSVEAMSLVLHHSRATGTAKVILLGIANHQGDGGSWPSIATLARYANVHERNARHAIEALVDTGEVSKTNRPGQATVYRVTVTCPRDCRGGMNHEIRASDDDPTPGASALGTPGGSALGRQRHPGRQRPDTPGGSALPPRAPAPYEPSMNQTGTKSKTPTESSRATPDRGTRIPDDFTLTPDMIAWAREHTPTTSRRDHDAFVDYWRAVPGAKGRKVDWPATWRGWMRREDEKRRPQAPRRSTTTERISQIDQAAAELAAQERAALTSTTPHLEIEGLTA